MKRLNAITLTPRARGITLACGLVIAAASPAWAAPESSTHYPKVLQSMVAAGKLKVVKQFPTDKAGMTGYIVKRGGYQTVVYSSDGYLMLGPLYGPDGKNLSQQYARKYTPKPNVAKVIDGLDAERLVTEGPDTAPTLYVFADPNCIFCHKLYEQTAPLVNAGKLQIHWVMVGVLGPSSVGRATTILGATDPAAALARNEANFDAESEQGGVAIGKTNADISQVLTTNRQAMIDVGSTGTPTVLFQDPSGEWQAREGLPPGGWLKNYAKATSGQ